MIDKLRYEELNKRMNRLNTVREQPLFNSDNFNVAHVVYVMETVKVCGGVKIILQHAERLVERGIKVTLVAHFPMPTWFSVKADFIQVPFGIELAAGIPECDLIIANYYKHIHSCIETGLAPVVYFEQGDYHLFEFENLDSRTKAFVFRQFQLPKFILTVTHKAAGFIKHNFGRDADVIPIAIDQKVFNTEVIPYEYGKPYILMMGLEETFKCIEDIIEAVSTLNDKGMDLDILWITPEQPQYDDSYYRNVKRIFVNPPQSQIASLYRGARLFVSASQYESFSLPVLEALSCFCPVVTTGNAGVLEYAQDSYNTLIANINDPKDLALKIERVLTDSRLSETIREHGLVTSQQFSWDEIMNRLVDYYNGCSGYTVINKSRLEDWELLISDQKLVNPQEYNKLMSLILNCEADYIQLPHLNQLIEGHQVAIWQTVAIRKERSNSKVERFLIYVHGDRKVPSVYEQAYEYFVSGSFDYAFKLFTNLFKLEEDSVERAVYAKWMILCLIGLGKVKDAEKLAHDFLEAYDDLTDVYYLLNYIHFVQFGNAHLDYENIISVIGEATAYPEFLYFGSN